MTPRHLSLILWLARLCRAWSDRLLACELRLLSEAKDGGWQLSHQDLLALEARLHAERVLTAITKARALNTKHREKARA